jgi:hypothetical protein
MRSEWHRRGDILRIDDGRGCLIEVSDGMLWLTQEGDARDVYLGRGDAFRLDRNGRAIAEAVSVSKVTISQPHSRAGFWRRLLGIARQRVSATVKALTRDPAAHSEAAAGGRDAGPERGCRRMQTAGPPAYR